MPHAAMDLSGTIRIYQRKVNNGLHVDVEY